MNENSNNSIYHQEIKSKLSPAHYFLLLILFLLLFACYKILQPYLHTIILAVILATVFFPIHYRLVKRLNRKRNLAAILSCILLTLVVVLPLMLILFSLIKQGIESFHAISLWIQSGKFNQLLDTPLMVKTIEFTNKYLPNIDLKEIKIDKALLDLSQFIGKALINQGGNLVGNVTALVGKFFLMIFVFFFVVRDAKKLVKNILHLSPLSATHEKQIIDKIRTVAKSALLGTFVTAVAQGAAGAIALWIAGLPALFWGIMMAFASLIPVVGTLLIWGPATVYLLLSGRWGMGIFVALWCAIVVGMIDNFVRPLFMKGSANMGTLVIFFSIIGGISLFGLIGILYGPLIFGLTMVFLYIYSLEFQEFLRSQDKI